MSQMAPRRAFDLSLRCLRWLPEGLLICHVTDIVKQKNVVFQRGCIEDSKGVGAADKALRLVRGFEETLGKPWPSLGQKKSNKRGYM
jgi:hypothetical protein